MNFTNWVKKHVITRYMMPKGCPEREKCFEVLQLILDGEGTEEDRKHFEQQMDSCWTCFQEYNVDIAVKDLLKQKIEKKEVPASLVDSIRSKINNLPR